MDWGAWRQWARYRLWLSGYWITMVILIVMSLFFVIGGRIRQSGGLILLVAALIATYFVYRRYQEDAELAAQEEAEYEQDDSEDDSVEQAERDDEETREEPRRQETSENWGANVFVGIFCGPVFVALLSAAIFALAARFGYVAPDDSPFGVGLLLGAWLGAFTWEVLGAEHTEREARAMQGFGGVAALFVIVGLALFRAHDPDRGLRLEVFNGILFALCVPLIWAELLTLSALRRPSRIDR